LAGIRQPGTFGPAAPFPLYTMPSAPGALEQQAMEAQKGMADFFGPLAQRDVSHVRRPVEAYHLPDAYAGTSEYLGSTLVYLMLNKNDFMMQEILPYRFSLNQHISWSRVQFDRTLPEIQGEEAVPRLVTTEQSEDGASMIRRGLGFRVEHGFTSTAAGRRDYELKLAAIACACSEVIAQSSLLALLNAPSSYGRELIQAEKATCLMDYFTNELFFFASMQKNEHAIYLLDKEIAGFFEKYGVEHDTYIVPPRMGMYAKIGDSGEIDYQKAGPAARRNLTASEGYATIGGKRMFEAARYELDNSDRALDVMNRNREIGGVFVVRYWGAHRDKNWHSEYSASKCTTEIYCAADDSIHSINLAQCVEAAFNDDCMPSVKRAYQTMLDGMHGHHRGAPSLPDAGAATVGSHLMLAAHHWGKDVLTSYFKILFAALQNSSTHGAFANIDGDLKLALDQMGRPIVGHDNTNHGFYMGPSFAYVTPPHELGDRIAPVFYPTWQSDHLPATRMPGLMKDMAHKCRGLSPNKAVIDLPHTSEQIMDFASRGGSGRTDYAADFYFTEGKLSDTFIDHLQRAVPEGFNRTFLSTAENARKIWEDCTGNGALPQAEPKWAWAAMLSSYVTYCHVVDFLQEKGTTGSALLNGGAALYDELIKKFDVRDNEDDVLPYGLMRATMRNTREAAEHRGFAPGTKLGTYDDNTEMGVSDTGSDLLKREIRASLNIIRRDMLYGALLTTDARGLETFVEQQRVHFLVNDVRATPNPCVDGLLAEMPLNGPAQGDFIAVGRVLCTYQNMRPPSPQLELKSETLDFCAYNNISILTKFDSLRKDLPYFGERTRQPTAAVPFAALSPPNTDYTFGEGTSGTGGAAQIAATVLRSLGVDPHAEALHKLDLAAVAAGWQTFTPGGVDKNHLLAKFFCTGLSHKNLLSMLHHDVPLPMAFLCTRPYRTYRCGSMIACQRGERLGYNFYGYPDFQVADDIISKTHTGHFTFQHAPAVINPQGTMTVPDVLITGYVGGENHRFIKHPDDLRNVGVENIITGAPRRGANSHASSAPQSIFALPTLNPFIGDPLCPCGEANANNEIPCPMFLGKVPDGGNGYEYRDDRFERFVHNEAAIPDALAKAFNEDVWRLPTDGNDGTGGLEARTAMFAAPFINHVAHHNEFCWQETQWGYVGGTRKIIHDKGHMGSKMRRPGCGNVYRGFYQSIVRTEITEEVM